MFLAIINDTYTEVKSENSTNNIEIGNFLKYNFQIFKNKLKMLTQNCWQIVKPKNNEKNTERQDEEQHHHQPQQDNNNDVENNESNDRGDTITTTTSSVEEIACQLQDIFQPIQIEEISPETLNE